MYVTIYHCNILDVFEEIIIYLLFQNLWPKMKILLLFDLLISACLSYSQKSENYNIMLSFLNFCEQILKFGIVIEFLYAGYHTGFCPSLD